MTRVAWMFSAMVAVGAIGCSGGAGSGPNDGGRELDDGHVQSGCQTDDDCDNGQKCSIARCDRVMKRCDYSPKTCPPPSVCNTNECDPKNGQCAEKPAQEGAACTTSQSLAGLCTSGYCQAIPSCRDPQFGGQLACSRGLNLDNFYNDPFLIGSGVTQAVDTYGNCAMNETAPEVAYQFSTIAEVDVTVRLRVDSFDNGPDGGVDAGSGDGGIVDGGGPLDLAGVDASGPPPGDVDLDLIVLEGDSCTSANPCVNPTLPTGGFQGITTGTGSEVVTFRAKPFQIYYLVVDGKNGATAGYHIEIESCGACQATANTPLFCNQTVPVQGNTASGKAALSSYTCTNGGFTATGKEQSFVFTGTAPGTQNVKATVMNASAPVTLAALPESNALACDAASCLSGATATGTAPNLSASVSFAAQNSEHYWVVVDSPQGSDSSFGLQLDCQPYCTQNDAIDCTSRTRSVTQGSSSNRVVRAWGPEAAACGGLTNLTGSEYVFLFAKPPTTTLAQYRFTLAATSAGKHLGLVILDAGATSPSSCDPLTSCANATPVTVAASATTLASTGTALAAGPMTSDGGPTGKTAVVDLATGTIDTHYYWVVVDGDNGDESNFAISLDSGCN